MSNNQKSIPGDQEGLGDWNNCPQGELSRMVRKLDASRARTRTKKLVQTSLLGMLLVAAGVVVSGSLLTSNSEGGYGGISCAECKSHFVEYHAHITGSELLEDLGLASSMAVHLADCRFCQSRFNASYPGVLQVGISISTQPMIRSPMPLLAVSRQPAF
ncbi:MAG: hypothetical protein GXP28_03515 [Planctomycetes bacterium]|nr:hypothetical protein [Planctomycetota bacterium]